MKNEYQLREGFWTPYEQMKEHTGKKFKVIRELSVLDEIEEEIQGELFEIELEDGLIIQAWFEEIYKDSCTIDGKAY